ncbi:MAG: NADH-quinone oxidoreductase subunit NuoE [Weeksellaceae bacterium]|jgi:NADH-quinone oxidoreductase subunit E|nr:NADH-quinone oxidoreductase subunit NuoE [Weeksellaceae bacterium]MDX9705485.1 NADH-quinone oxidoreductase subunit NuoE [Weeksellaceae bacterium]
MAKVQFSDEAYKKIQEIITRYPEGKQKSALIPTLHIAQAESNGWLSPEVMEHVAEILNILPVEVYEVATFYTMFNLKPVGKYVLEVCQTGPCAICGSDKIIEHIKKKLNIEIGGTSADGLFTLKPSECLGACGYAPMMLLGKHYQEHLTIEKVDEILEELKNQA